MFQNLRDTFAFWLVFCNLLFGNGFKLIMVPVWRGISLPLNEVSLCLLLCLIRYDVLLSRAIRAVYFYPLLFFWLYGFTRALQSYRSHGLWALRDATPIIDSLFFLVGIAFILSIPNIVRMLSYLTKLLIVASFFQFLVLFSDTLQALPLNISNLSGESVSIFFSFTTTSFILLWTSFYLLFVGERTTPFWIALAFIFIALTVLIIQSRSNYVQIAVIIMFIILYKRNRFLYTAWFVLLGFTCLAVLQALDLELLKGRIGNFSLDFFVDHVASSFGIYSEQAKASTDGIYLRAIWWQTVWEKWTASYKTFLFGVGYGEALIDFGSTREPHNSFLSCFVRSGLIGGILLIAVQVSLLVHWWRGYVICRQNQFEEGKDVLFFFLAFFFIILSTSMSQDTLEKPYAAIPYYFYWGIAVGYVAHLQECFTSNKPAAIEQT